MSVVRIGVIGAGYMGHSYAQLIQQHPLTELTGLADINPEAGRAVAERLGTRYYPSTSELLSRERPQAIIVATVENAHRESCLAALENNVAVLVEKPIATTIEDGAAIVAAAQRTGQLLMVGHILRFDTRYALLRETVASGQIGDPLTVTARRLNGRAAQDRLRGRCSLPVFLGVHDYDAVRWIAGSEVTQVVAQSRFGFLAGQGYNVEDATWALLTFANGVLAAVEEGWILPNGHPSGFEQRLDVTGTTGRAELAAAYQGLTVIGEDRARWPDTALWPSIHSHLTGALEREVSHFIDCVQHDRIPLVTGEDGQAALQIALAVEESARTNRPVSL